MSQTVTEQFVRDGFGFLNARALDSFFALYSDDLRNPGLANMGLPPNKDGFKAFINGFYAAFSEPAFTPQQILCDHPVAMFRWVFTGKHTGEFNGLPPTGKSVKVEGFTTFRMGPDGKVVEQHEVADMLTLLKQLGAA